MWLLTPPYLSLVAGPVGLSLEKDSHGRQCLVRTFRQVPGPDGKLIDGPAQRSGLVAVGDLVTEIDGEDVLELTFKQTMMRLRKAQEVRVCEEQKTRVGARSEATS